jgi:hypothetical protein
MMHHSDYEDLAGTFLYNDVVWESPEDKLLAPRVPAAPGIGAKGTKSS